MKIYSRSLFQIILGMIFLTSCTKAESIAPTITETLTIAGTLNPAKVVSSSRTPRPTATFTSTPDFNNPAFQPHNGDELQDFVLFNLNLGKTIIDINSLFDQRDRRRIWIDGSAVDFDGDGENELFLATSIYRENEVNNENLFWIAKRVQGQYDAVHSISEIADYGAQIAFIDDLNSDNLPDLIFTRPLYGNGSGADIFVAQFEELSFSIQQVAETNLIIDKIRVDAQSTNDDKTLVVIGFESGWGSSGPGRTIKEVYSINGKRYALSQSLYLPGDYRIHVLQDAQIAYDSGDEELAVEFWKQAAHDQTLENFPSMWIENDVPEKYQPAFAVYRLYTYFLSENDEENAQIYWTELNNKYPESSPGGEFISLATEAKRLLGGSKDTNVVCNGIYEFLNSTTENVNFLMEHWYWGDHNLDIIDFCPLPR